VEETLDQLDAADCPDILEEMKDLRAYLLSPRVKRQVCGVPSAQEPYVTVYII